MKYSVIKIKLIYIGEVSNLSLNGLTFLVKNDIYLTHSVLGFPLDDIIDIYNIDGTFICRWFKKDFEILSEFRDKRINEILNG